MCPHAEGNKMTSVLAWNLPGMTLLYEDITILLFVMNLMLEVSDIFQRIEVNN